MATKRGDFVLRGMNPETAISQALRECGFSVISRGDSWVRARSGLSLRSWGEELVVSWAPKGTLTIIEVSSAPRAQLFDLGKSAENVQRVFATLTATLGAPS